MHNTINTVCILLSCHESCPNSVLPKHWNNFLECNFNTNFRLLSSSLLPVLIVGEADFLNAYCPGTSHCLEKKHMCWSSHYF